MKHRTIFNLLMIVSITFALDVLSVKLPKIVHAQESKLDSSTKAQISLGIASSYRTNLKAANDTPDNILYDKQISPIQTISILDDGDPTLLSLYVLTKDGIEKVSSTGIIETMIATHGESYSVEILNNELYISEKAPGGNILVYDLEGSYLKTISIPPQANQYIRFVTIPDGRIALLDNVSDKVYFIDSTGILLATTNILDDPDLKLQNLDGVVVNNQLLLSEDGNNRILQIDLNTYDKSVFKDLTNLPHSLGAIAYSGGQYYICDSQTIYTFSKGIDLVKSAEIPGVNITGVIVIGGFAYVSLNFAGSIYKVDLSTGSSSMIVSGLNYPKDLEVMEEKGVKSEEETIRPLH